jgi:triacylglycerol lipase
MNAEQSAWRRARQFLKAAAATFAALAALTTTGAAFGANNYPIVLVHGFLGFGPNELQGTGFKYWGGFNDVEGSARP